MIRFFEPHFDHAVISSIANLATKTQQDNFVPKPSSREKFFRLALTIFLLFSLPALAEPTGDSWTAPCNENLNSAIDDGVLYLEIFPEFTPDEKATLTRKIAAVHALCIDRLITVAETMKKNDWSREDRKRFVMELIWVRDLLNGEMAEIYRQSKIYQARGGDDYARILANLLHYWTLDAKYPPVLYDLAQESIERDEGSSGALGLQSLADDGHTPAMLDAARRFLIGDGVKVNLGIAYYWIKRTEAAGGDVSSILVKPHEDLFQKMTAFEIRNFGYMLVRYGDLDWTNIEVPDFELPPIETLP